MSAPRTQKQRVLAALRRSPVTQVDFLSPTCDGGPPILRLPARVEELRNDGWPVRVVGKRDRCALYRLVDDRAPAPGKLVAKPTPATELFAPQVGRGPAIGPYDVEDAA